MNLRRKIAAALAAVMAVGSVGVMNLDARQFSHGAGINNGIHGELVGHASTHRLVDVHSPAWDAARAANAGNVHSHVDFVVAGPQLHQQGTDIQSLVLTIDGPGFWNYGTPNIYNNAQRATVTPGLTIAGTPQLAVRPQTTGLGWRTVPVPQAGQPNVATPDGRWGFQHTRGLGLTGGGGADIGTGANALDFILAGHPLPPAAPAWVAADVAWANNSNRAYLVRNHVAHQFANYVTAGGPRFLDWSPVVPDGPHATAALWATALFATPQATGAVPVNNDVLWMNRIAAFFPGEGLTTGTVANPNFNFFLVPLTAAAGNSFSAAVIRYPDNPATQELTLVGAFHTTGYGGGAVTWSTTPNERQVDLAWAAVPGAFPLGIDGVFGSTSGAPMPAPVPPAAFLTSADIGNAELLGVIDSIVPAAGTWRQSHNWNTIYSVGPEIGGRNWFPITSVATGATWQFGIGAAGNLTMPTIPPNGLLSGVTGWTTTGPNSVFRPIVSQTATLAGTPVVARLDTAATGIDAAGEPWALTGTGDLAGIDQTWLPHALPAGESGDVTVAPTAGVLTDVAVTFPATLPVFHQEITTATVVGTDAGITATVPATLPADITGYYRAMRIWPTTPMANPGQTVQFMTEFTGAPLATLPIAGTSRDFVAFHAGGVASQGNLENWRLLVFEVDGGIAPTARTFADAAAMGVATAGINAVAPTALTTADITAQTDAFIAGETVTAGDLSALRDAAIATIPSTLTNIPANNAATVTAMGGTASTFSGTTTLGNAPIPNGVWWYPTVAPIGFNIGDAILSGAMAGAANVGSIPGIPMPPWGGGGTVDTGTHLSSILVGHSIGNAATSGQRFTQIAYSGRVFAGNTRNEIPFVLTFYGLNEMRITWDANDVEIFGGANETVLRVPLAVQANGTGSIYANVNFGGTGTGAGVGGDRQAITGAGQGVRLQREGDVTRGHMSVILPQMRLVEIHRGFVTNRVPAANQSLSVADSTWNQQRAFTLTLPEGYVWNWTNTGTHPIGFVGTGRLSGFGAAVNTEAFMPNLTRNTPIALDAANRPGFGTPFIFTSNDPDTGAHRLHVVMNGWQPAAAGGASELWVNNLRVAHRNPANPSFNTADQYVTLQNGYGSGFSTMAWETQVLQAVGVPVENLERVLDTGMGALSAVVTPERVAFFVLAPQGLTLNPAPGAAGELTTVIAGRTYRGPVSLNPDAFPGSIEVFDALSRRVRVEETVPSAALNRELRFTLTDADGNPSDTAKIAAVQFNSEALGGPGTAGQLNGFPGNRNFHNAVPAVGQAHRILGTQSLYGQVSVTFSEDGRSVSVIGLQANDPANRRMRLDAQFWLSTDVNSDEPVFVTLSQRGAGMAGFDYDFVYPSATLQLANVDKLFEIEADYTDIPHRAQRIEVEDVIITELRAGALRLDRQVEVVLAELGQPTTRTELGFNPITAAHIATTDGLTVGVLPTPLGSHAIRMNVNTVSSRTAGGAELSLVDLDIFVNQAVPVGTYGVMARGNAILDNDIAEINRRLGGGTNPNAPMFRRYGFGGLLTAPFVNVTQPGAYGGVTGVNPATARVVATQNSHLVLVNNQEVAMTNVHGQATPMFHQNGANFFPMRGIAQVYGAEQAVSWTFVTSGGERTVDWQPGVEVEVTVSLAGRTIVFTTGSTTFTVNGASFTADRAPMNVGGTVFIPFAALGHALGVPVSWEGYGAGQQFFFNMYPERGTLVTLNGDAPAPAVAPEPADEPVADDNGYYYNNYYNNNGDEEDAA